jgi:hypothetical protein
MRCIGGRQGKSTKHNKDEGPLPQRQFPLEQYSRKNCRPDCYTAVHNSENGWSRQGGSLQSDKAKNSAEYDKSWY